MTPSVAHCPALLISAPASGQGKTSVTAALARWHTRAGKRVRVFKTGPDFLDPMVLERACGAPVQQLDLWMCGEDDIRARLYRAACEADLILVEGVMGLFDGGLSSADHAQRLGLPVLVVIDGSAMAQTFGAVALGLASYREGLNVYGVAANRIGGAYHAQLLAESVPCDLQWLGALPRDAALELPERHLGLVQPAEFGEMDARLDALADAWATHASLSLPPASAFEAPQPDPPSNSLRGRRIAIARDAAFCFIYPANLELLRDAGADLVFFSPLAGESLPACDAVWLPGGYPELHLPVLARNVALKAALQAHVDAGRPLLAECGGMLYTLDTLSDRDGETFAMVGLLPGRAVMQERLGGLGLQSASLPEGTVRGHTFHYAHAEIDIEPIVWAANPDGGPSREGVYRRGRMTASFMHAYFPSHREAAQRLFLP